MAHRSLLKHGLVCKGREGEGREGFRVWERVQSVSISVNLMLPVLCSRQCLADPKGKPVAVVSCVGARGGGDDQRLGWLRYVAVCLLALVVDNELDFGSVARAARVLVMIRLSRLEVSCEFGRVLREPLSAVTGPGLYHVFYDDRSWDHL